MICIGNHRAREWDDEEELEASAEAEYFRECAYCGATVWLCGRHRDTVFLCGRCFDAQRHDGKERARQLGRRRERKREWQRRRRRAARRTSTPIEWLYQEELWGEAV